VLALLTLSALTPPSFACCGEAILTTACLEGRAPIPARFLRRHRLDWADTHYTVLDLLDVLCVHHHKLKTREGWALITGTGKRPFVPPADPRHPKHERPPPDARAAA
jgi:hypothetical protein